jgi:hypothetical protein
MIDYGYTDLNFILKNMKLQHMVHQDKFKINLWPDWNYLKRIRESQQEDEEIYQ